MKAMFLSLAAVMAVALLGGCVTPERKPTGPVSQEDPKPWNRMQPGEGQGMFGGALQRR